MRLFRRRNWAAAGAVLVALVISGCGESPVEVVFEVIEEVEFAAALGIDLAAMEKLGTGVYRQDIVVGGGEPAVFGTTPTLTFTGWLKNGTQFETGTFSFRMGNNAVVSGLEDGLVGARVGGTRRIIIPPGRGYGGQARLDLQGNVVIPGGSIMVFVVTVDAVN